MLAQPGTRPPGHRGVDGRGASGKTTLATRLHDRLVKSAVVHTDDLAWNEPLFAWADLLADGVLRPVHRGEAIHFTPPAWRRYGRAGRIDVPAGLDVVLIEGTGANQRDFADLIDTTIWVQADFIESERRGLARDIEHGTNGDAAQTTAFWHHWMSAELAFLGQQKHWTRANLIANGTVPPGDTVTLALEVLAPTGSPEVHRFQR